MGSGGIQWDLVGSSGIWWDLGGIWWDLGGIQWDPLGSGGIRWDRSGIQWDPVSGPRDQTGGTGLDQLDLLLQLLDLQQKGVGGANPWR